MSENAAADRKRDSHSVDFNISAKPG
jgi:hypothetical protein